MNLNVTVRGQEKSDPMSTMRPQSMDDKKEDRKNPGLEGHVLEKEDPGLDQTACRQDPEEKIRPDPQPFNAHPVRDVERKTELQGMSMKVFPEQPSQIRKRTQRDLKLPNSEIPYAKMEKAIRDLVCALMERQDRMNTAIFLEINSMNEDIGMLKDQLYTLRTTKTGSAADEKK